MRVRPDVAKALAAGQAVVALESTIISHGAPVVARSRWYEPGTHARLHLNTSEHPEHQPKQSKPLQNILHGTPSTATSAGMPHPQNLEMARQVEADVRAGGAIPATIGLLDGEVIVRGARWPGPSSRKDITQISAAAENILR